MTHVVGDAAFVGDTLFMPDGGSARADFPGGDARTLYRSSKRVLSLPPETRLFMCHDYGPNGRDIQWETSVEDEREHNIHLRDGISEDEFVAMREARDKTLGHAQAHHSLAAGQHARGPASTQGRKRQGLPQGSGQQALTCNATAESNNVE